MDHATKLYLYLYLHLYLHLHLHLYLHLYLYLVKSGTSCEMEHDTAEIGESKIMKEIGKE